MTLVDRDGFAAYVAALEALASAAESAAARFSEAMTRLPQAGGEGEVP